MKWDSFWEVIRQIFEGDKPQPVPPKPSKRLKLLAAAQSFLGKEASPLDKVPDEVACVESLGNVARPICPFPDVYGTWDALKFLKNSSHWRGTLEALPGNLIINATGTGNGKLRGHCGVILEGGRIASNNSKTGLWTDFYTIDTWKKRYRIDGAMPTYVFEPL